MSTQENPVTVLSDEESWKRLETQPIGRLVTHVKDVIDIVPVNYVVDRGSLVFRTAAGSKLLELTINSEVVFEVDSYGGEGGWSVVVRGEARALEGEAEIAAVEKLPLNPFVPTVKPTFVRIEVEVLHGRAFVFGPEPKREDLQEG